MHCKFVLTVVLKYKVRGVWEDFEYNFDDLMDAGPTYARGWMVLIAALAGSA
jgi:hypothetical protein